MVLHSLTQFFLGIIQVMDDMQLAEKANISKRFYAIYAEIYEHERKRYSLSFQIHMRSELVIAGPKHSMPLTRS